jgi:hypothetical protein
MPPLTWLPSGLLSHPSLSSPPVSTSAASSAASSPAVSTSVALEGPGAKARCAEASQAPLACLDIDADTSSWSRSCRSDTSTWSGSDTSSWRRSCMSCARAWERVLRELTAANARRAGRHK